MMSVGRFFSVLCFCAITSSSLSWSQSSIPSSSSSFRLHAQQDTAVSWHAVGLCTAMGQLGMPLCGSSIRGPSVQVGLATWLKRLMKIVGLRPYHRGALLQKAHDVISLITYAGRPLKHLYLSEKMSILPPLRSTDKSWENLHLKPLVHWPCRKYSQSIDFGSTPVQEQMLNIGRECKRKLYKLSSSSSILQIDAHQQELWAA